MLASSSLPSRALTVKQPWAELIASGRKPLEIRSWATNYRGPLGIHAGKADSLLAMELFVAAAARQGDDIRPAVKAWPRGALIATTYLADVRPFLEADIGAACCPWSPDRFAWVLKDTRRLPQPISMPGALGLWRLPPEFP